MRMVSRYLTAWAFLAVLSLLSPAGAPYVPESMLLPDNMDLFCGDVDVCKRNNTEHRNQTTSASNRDKVFCCNGCSCDDTCVQTGDCCFPPSGLGSGTECIFPTTTTSTEKNELGYNSYWMVSIDANENALEHSSETCHAQDVSNTSCGQTQYPPFGRLLPVYSKHFQAIYKNPACAASHGVTDGIIWQAMVICPRSFRAQDASFIQWLEYDMIPPACHVDFTYPGDQTDVQPHLCYRDMTDTCDGEPFTIPERMNISTAQVRSLCESGFMSPAFYIPFARMYAKHYSNVFCLICNNNNGQSLETGSQKQCNLPVDTFTARTARFLLKADYVTNIIERPIYINLPNACEKLNSSNCRELKCPLHQFRGPAGDCDSVVYDRLDDIICRMLLNVSIEGVDVTNKNVSQNLETLVSVWNEINPWTPPINIYYQLKHNISNNSEMQTLFVDVTFWYEQIAPIERVLERVHTIMNKQWILKMNNTEIKIQQSFAKCSLMTSRWHRPNEAAGIDITRCHDQLTDVDMRELNVTPPLMFWEHRYLRRIEFGRRPSVIHLNKLFFCEQIELQPNEFTLYAAYSVMSMPMAYALYNKLTGRLMLDNEFWLVTQSNGDTLARICLSDSGYRKQELQTSATGRLNIPVALMAVCCWMCLYHEIV